MQWIMQPDPDSRKQRTYFSHKTEFRKEPYIIEAKNVHHRRIIASFRTGSHGLSCSDWELQRLRGGFEHRLCPTCSDEIEDEMHAALFACHDYDHLRVKYADLV